MTYNTYNISYCNMTIKIS